MTAITVETTTTEPLIIGGIVSQFDPGSNLPQFQLTATDAADPDDADWVNGTWSGTWSSTDGTGLEAVSPLVGSTGFEIAAGRQLLWVRWTAGTHTPVRRAATIYGK